MGKKKQQQHHHHHHHRKLTAKSHRSPSTRGERNERKDESGKNDDSVLETAIPVEGDWIGLWDYMGRVHSSREQWYALAASDDMTIMPGGRSTWEDFQRMNSEQLRQRMLLWRTWRAPVDLLHLTDLLGLSCPQSNFHLKSVTSFWELPPQNDRHHHDEDIHTRTVVLPLFGRVGELIRTLVNESVTAFVNHHLREWTQAGHLPLLAAAVSEKKDDLYFAFSFIRQTVEARVTYAKVVLDFNALMDLLDRTQEQYAGHLPELTDAQRAYYADSEVGVFLSGDVITNCLRECQLEDDGGDDGGGASPFRLFFGDLYSWHLLLLAYFRQCESISCPEIPLRLPLITLRLRRQPGWQPSCPSSPSIVFAK